MLINIKITYNRTDLDNSIYIIIQQLQVAAYIEKLSDEIYPDKPLHLRSYEYDVLYPEVSILIFLKKNINEQVAYSILFYLGRDMGLDAERGPGSQES
jgi:hypothetical protein